VGTALVGARVGEKEVGDLDTVGDKVGGRVAPAVVGR
jgi:hypothetical protein